MSDKTNQGLTRRRVLQLSAGLLSAQVPLMEASQAAISKKSPTGNVVVNSPGGHFFSAAELALLANVVEVIVPTTDTPGARSANVHGFLDKLLADWALPQTQADFRALLGEIDAQAGKRFGAAFSLLEPSQQFELIAAMDAAAFSPGASLSPFVRFKALVFLGYYHSEIGATHELQYELIPGHYEPCVAFPAGSRPWLEEYWNDDTAFSQVLGP